jgi:hypothetical protein
MVHFAAGVPMPEQGAPPPVLEQTEDVDGSRDTVTVTAAIVGIAATFFIAVVFTFVSIFVRGWVEYISLVVLAICFLATGIWTSRRFDQLKWERRRRELEEKAYKSPDKASAAWELAKEKLENYFDRNLGQVKMVFYVAVAVMAAGFGFVLWGIKLSFLQPDHVAIAIIASASGVITQFIGLTFMVIYRSTMAQAGQFVSVLERINTVGMVIQILDSMSTSAPDLKDRTRAEIIRQILLVSDAPELRSRPESQAAAVVRLPLGNPQ